VSVVPGFLATALPIGDHWWIIGGKDSVMNIHMDTVVLTLAVMFVLLALGLYIRNTVTAGPPSRLQNAVETVVQFLNNIIEENLGRDPGTISTIALTLFFFIWIANLIGLLPVPTYVHSPTSDINATFALALLVFVLVNIRAFQTNGFGAYKGHYWTSWRKPYALPLNAASLLLGLVNELSRPLTLSFRLFGNILAGEVLLIVWAFLLAPSVGVPVTALWNTIFVAYGVFVGTIQAFIFTVLTVAYMAIASEPAHEH
jgi:F-type H+-transporting ATPase subunit a